MMLTPVKKTLLSACATLLCLSASAGLLVEETFDYPNGAFNGRNGGTGFTTAWSNFSYAPGAITINDQKASLNGSTSGGSASAGWSSATRKINPIDFSSGGEFYFSYDINAASLVAITERSYFDAFNFMSGTSTLFGSGLFYSGNSYRMRSQVTNGATANMGAAYTVGGTPMVIVGKFSYDADTSAATISYWIDPTAQGATPLYSYSWTIADLGVIDGIRLQRYDDYRVGASNTTFADIRIGTDWASVTTPIPEPSHAMLLLGGIAVAMAATQSMRRRMKR